LLSTGLQTRSSGRADVGFSDASERLGGTAWPPFVLVTGLLLIGLTAHRDGLFERPGSSFRASRTPRRCWRLVCCWWRSSLRCSIWTPPWCSHTVLVHAARGRGIEEEAFLYGTVYMANASSLYLPGSNLTNLLVLPTSDLRGTFACGCWRSRSPPR